MTMSGRSVRDHDWCVWIYEAGVIFSIYTLSDLGDFSNLIGSLSRTIQQYSPPSEWIMCELGFFPIFLPLYLLFLLKSVRAKFLH